MVSNKLLNNPPVTAIGILCRDKKDSRLLMNLPSDKTRILAITKLVPLIR
jgi:hypothetical protein